MKPSPSVLFLTLIVGLMLLPGTTAAQAGRPQTDSAIYTLPLAPASAQAGLATYMVVAGSAARIIGDTAGSFRAAVGYPHLVRVRIVSTAPADTSPLATLRVRWVDGSTSNVPILAAHRDSPPAPARVATAGRNIAPTRTTSLELEVELLPQPRTVGPGSVIALRYHVSNYEDNDHRVRVRVVLPSGWELLDTDIERQEHELEGYGGDIIGDMRILASKSAKPGERVYLRVQAQAVGDPGFVEGIAMVDVGRRGGFAPGVVGLNGTAFMGTRGAVPAADDAGRAVGSVDLAGRFSGNTNVSISYRRGPRPDQAPVSTQFTNERTWASFDLRNRNWSVNAGNGVSAQGSLLMGPYARTLGAIVRRNQGRIAGEIAAGQPDRFGGRPEGFLARAKIGPRWNGGSILLVGSTFTRPNGEWWSGSRVEAAGMEATLRRGGGSSGPGGRPRTMHDFLVRGGFLRAQNLKSDSLTSGPAVEASYSLYRDATSITLRHVTSPATVRGVYIPGLENSISGHQRILGPLRTVFSASHSEAHTLGAATHWESDNLAGGLRLMSSRGARLEARMNYREGRSAALTRRRSISGAAGAPLGKLYLDLWSEHGTQLTRNPAAVNPEVLAPFDVHRVSARYLGQSGWISFGTTYSDYGSNTRQLRSDISGSLKRSSIEIDGGAWASKFRSYGGDPGAWLSLGIPVRDYTIHLGVEYMRWPATYRQGTIPTPPSADTLPGEPVDVAPPIMIRETIEPWRVNFGIRRGLAVPLPFLSDRRAPALRTAARKPERAADSR
jgi:hypothetical protein